MALAPGLSPFPALTKRLSEGQRKAFPGLSFPLSMGTKQPRQWLDQESLNSGGKPVFH